MARIRTIKPEFWTSEQIVECSPNARLLFIGLWNFCDDAGRHPASSKRLKMEVFPADDFGTEKVSGWVDELIRVGLVEFYLVGSEGFWQVTGWHHQKVERPTIKYPPNPQFTEHSPITHRTVGEQSPPERNGAERSGTETSGTERNGMEGSLRASGARARSPDADAHKCACDPGRLAALVDRADRIVKPNKPQDRSLIEKSARLALLEFGEHWFIDALEATRLAFSRDKPPKGPRGGYFHGVLKSKCEEMGKGNFNSHLASIELSETDSLTQNELPKVQFKKPE